MKRLLLTLILINAVAHAQTTFTNSTAITITDGSTATAYPSSITASGLTGSISKVSVTLSSITAPRPGNLDIMLVAPDGAAFLMLSDARSNTAAVTGVSLTLDDAGAISLPMEPVL